MISKIVCPLDFSDNSIQALQMALPIADANHAAIHLLHIIPEIFLYDWSMTNTFNFNSAEILDQSKQDAELKLKNFIDDYKSKFSNVVFHYNIITLSDAVDGILNISKEINADLIVMGSHGRKGWDRVLMGSVAESVMRNSNCPVMIYRM